jgi:hypothetical protein
MILKKTFLNLNNLESLDISYHDSSENPINDNGYLNLNEIIKCLTNLKYLYLNCNRISDNSFENLKECLITHQSLTYLDLIYVDFFDNSTKPSMILNEIFSKNSIINTLNLDFFKSNNGEILKEGFMNIKNINLLG